MATRTTSETATGTKKQRHAGRLGISRRSLSARLQRAERVLLESAAADQRARPRR